MCESRGGRPGFPTPNSPYGLFGRKATLKNRAHKLYESRGTRRGLPVPNSPYGLCGCKATLERKKKGRYCLFRGQELYESRGTRRGLPAPNSLYGPCGRKATLKNRIRSCRGLPVPDTPYGLCGRKSTLTCSITKVRSCVKVEVAVLGFPSLIVIIVSGRKATLKNRALELCESRGGRPGLPVPNSPNSLWT